jgi:hypothetical protein
MPAPASVAAIPVSEPAPAPIAAIPVREPAPAQIPSGQPGSAELQEKLFPKSGYDAMEFRTIREVPGLEVLTRLESEAAWMERMRQETLKTQERIVFPDEPILAKAPYPGRHWTPVTKMVEPSFVVHERLLFEQKDFERGAWDLGIFTPGIEYGKFLIDTAFIPYNVATRPFQQYETSAGKCLPGDPSALYLYPVEISLTGLVAEGAAVSGAIFMVFP